MEHWIKNSSKLAFPHFGSSSNSGKLLDSKKPSWPFFRSVSRLIYLNKQTQISNIGAMSLSRRWGRLPVPLHSAVGATLPPIHLYIERPSAAWVTQVTPPESTSQPLVAPVAPRCELSPGNDASNIRDSDFGALRGPRGFRGPARREPQVRRETVPKGRILLAAGLFLRSVRGHLPQDEQQLRGEDLREGLPEWVRRKSLRKYVTPAGASFCQRKRVVT